MGTARDDSTFVAIFLWTMLEAYFVHFMLFAYHYKVFRKDKAEKITLYTAFGKLLLKLRIHVR